MIPKASQRGGGQQLATHLLNEFDNDRVEVAHVRGAIARDLHGAFAEWRAISRATQCRKYLYSLSLNPDPKQGPLSRAQYLDFIDRAEKRLGLGDQPRAVVFHVKYGREHCHVVWSRINESSMKAVQLSHDHQNLRTVAREFARAHDLRLPKGMEQDRGTERYKERQKVENLLEQQQEERSGVTKAERIASITAAWRATGDGRTFVAALERQGYLLARGDARAYVVVDRAGEIHSLARQIEGARARDVKDRLSAYPIAKVPDARRAQAFLREKRQREQALRMNEGAAEPRRSPMERRQDLAQRHARRRAGLDAQKEVLEKEHEAERLLLQSAQTRDAAVVQHARAQAKPGRTLAFLMRITGIGRLVERHRQRQDAVRDAEHERQRDKLERRHHRERVDFRHREHALESVEARECRSLETRIRRESFQRATGRDRNRGRAIERDERPPPRHAPEATPPHTATKPATHPASVRETLTHRFTVAAGWCRGALSAIFNGRAPSISGSRYQAAPHQNTSALSAIFRACVDPWPCLPPGTDARDARAAEVVGDDASPIDRRRLAHAFSNPQSAAESPRGLADTRSAMRRAFEEAATADDTAERERARCDLLDTFRRSARPEPAPGRVRRGGRQPDRGPRMPDIGL
jgi:hypothetical protein